MLVTRTTNDSIQLVSLLSPATAGCERCLARLRDHLLALPGVQAITLDDRQRQAVVEYDPTTVSLPELERVIETEGQRLDDAYAHELVAIEGMDCADCAATVERGVARIDGVGWASVNFAGARMAVEYAPDQTSLAAIAKLVASLGYRLSSESAPGDATPIERSRLGRLLTERENAQTLVGVVLVLLGLVTDLAGSASWLPIGLYTLAIGIAGLPIARKGIATLRATHRLDINLLMTIAVIGAAAIGEWLEAATVVILFSLGEGLERYTMDRARRSIRSLMTLAPADALVRRDGREDRVPVAAIVPGDLIIVRPGDRLPVDGVVVGGQSVVDQAPVTGESIPVEKGADSDVFAGTINGAGVLEVRASRPASDSTIARIIRMVEDAQAQKAPTQRFVDVFAMYYTPGVVAIAALLAIGPPLVVDASWSSWIYRALVLLVIACPCALVISTPVSIVAAISAAARNGVLIKGGAYLEAAGSLRALAFDKTGTLTVGQPQVTQTAAFNGAAEADILRLAASVEQYSEHPLGEAIVAAARQRGIAPNGSRVEAVTARIGHGIEARVDGTPVAIGTRALVLDGTTDAAIDACLSQIEATGQTAVLVRHGETVVGIIALADQLRPNAAAAVAGLHAAGIRETVMLTGDRQAVAAAIAASVGIAAVRAELLPDQKVAAVEDLLAIHGRVGMVGDGINDAPALARATVGIAMGAAGTQTALETADIALMSDDLSKLAFTMRLSRSARRIIAQNIGLSLGIKVVFLTLAVIGTATLWEAIVADVGASLVVTANGMRLLRQRAE